MRRAQGAGPPSRSTFVRAVVRPLAATPRWRPTFVSLAPQAERLDEERGVGVGREAPVRSAVVSEGAVGSDVDAALDGRPGRRLPGLLVQLTEVLGHAQRQLQEHPPLRHCEVELRLARAGELAAMLHQFAERRITADQRAGEAIEPVDDDALALPAADALHDRVEDRPVHRAAGDVLLGRVEL